ncbi:hypothetical protein BCR44DRAFT_1502563 [Catenaria anguillulae PL171]|uniref:Uncharacterized protein n=1 Tax=Catenaria anguillulae PL171 TaxID=765915 RepID=A0A1Y2HB28_9FUNG|nr:hypothetical protein BCR44DRAFT_1502563 [Catenaria anguillulae PL171]
MRSRCWDEVKFNLILDHKGTPCKDQQNRCCELTGAVRDQPLYMKDGVLGQFDNKLGKTTHSQEAAQDSRHGWNFLNGCGSTIGSIVYSMEPAHPGEPSTSQPPNSPLQFQFTILIPKPDAASGRPSSAPTAFSVTGPVPISPNNHDDLGSQRLCASSPHGSKLAFTVTPQPTVWTFLSTMRQMRHSFGQDYQHKKQHAANGRQNTRGGLDGQARADMSAMGQDGEAAGVTSIFSVT